MPVILPPDAYQCWLDARSSPDALDALLRPYAPDNLVALAVASRVNNARHDDAACLEPAIGGLLS